MDVRSYIEEHAREFFDELREWLAIPSISADPGHHPDVRASAEWLAAHLRGTGFPEVEIWETGTGGSPGLPAVFACWPAADPAAPSVCVYGHHDVQPADPLTAWDFPPFEPTESGGQLRGRGASDDKGQVMFHALGLRACLAAAGGQAPPVTVKLLVVAADVTFRGPDTDLHSGSFGGGVPNPLHAMASLLAGLHDDKGRVTLPGFYDGVMPLSQQERALFARLPFEEKTWLADAGSSQATAGEAGYTTLERIWARPTAEVNGMWGGYTGPGAKTIVPREAHAKLSFRLVANQQPAEIIAALVEYVASHTPPGIEAVVTPEGPGVRACFSSLDSPAVRAGKRAMERAFGSEVLFTREGGSGPEADLAEILGAPLVFLAVGLDSDRIHAPNEKVEKGLLLKAAEAAAYLWYELAADR